MTPVVVALVALVSSVIGGVISSLVAPFVNWGIEKRRNQASRQRMLIDNARLLLSGKAAKRENIRTSRAYVAIRSHLSSELIASIEAHNTSGGEQKIQDTMMQEISELEKKWKLI